MKLLSLFKKSKSTPNDIIVVSGLPRSGTSMMMQILQSGGLQVMTDQIRAADTDNPKGYYEFERVKKLKDGDNQWVKEAPGKVVKVISALLESLPTEYQYKIIFMQRDMQEILASQKQMLIRRGEATDKTSDEVMSEYFRRHLASVQEWLARQPNMKVLYIQYDALLKDARPHIESIVKFLGFPLDVDTMSAVPDQTLYRQKHMKK